MGLYIDQAGELASASTVYIYTLGQLEVVTFERNDCTESNSCQTCIVMVDAVECDSCDVVPCLDASGNEVSRGVSVDCRNVESGSRFDTCVSPFVVDTGVFEVLSQGEFERGRRDPLEACEAVAAYESNVAEGTSCECIDEQQGTGIGVGVARMVCRQADCLYCNYEGNVCGMSTFGRVFNEIGTMPIFYYGFQYTKGRTELVRFEESVDVDGGCSVKVDGVSCDSCDYTTCDVDGVETRGINVQCENIEVGSSYIGCGDIYIETGLFALASTYDFNQCLESETTIAAACANRAANLVEFGYETRCDCAAISGSNNYLLTCTHEGCLKCNADHDTCGYETYSATYGLYGRVVNTASGFKYIEGRSDIVSITKMNNPILGTRDHVATRDCVATINGNVCDSCGVVGCENKFGIPYEGYEVTCDNVAGGASFSLCDRVGMDDSALGIENTAFHFESINQSYASCDHAGDPLIVCESIKNAYETTRSTGAGTVCECMEHDEGGYFLSCDDTGCQYCSADQSVCAMYLEYGGFINSVGIISDFFDTYEYTKGLANQRLTVEDTGSTCNVAIGGDDCNSCEHVTCTDEIAGFEFGGFQIDCTNVADEYLYKCRQGAGVFQALGDALFSQCIPITPMTTSPPGGTDTGDDDDAAVQVPTMFGLLVLGAVSVWSLL
jgi:hypothetical protein